MTMLQRIGVRLLFTGRIVFENWIPLSAWALLLGLVEIVGRTSKSDIVDLGLALLCVMCTSIIHTTRPLPPVTFLRRCGEKIWRKVIVPSLDLGVDLRGEPPIPRQFPKPLRIFSTILLTGNITALITLAYYPSGVKELFQPYCYLAYLSLISVLWVSMLFLGLMLIFIASTSIRDLFVMSFLGQGKRPRRRERLTIWLICFGIVAAAMVLPVWTPIAYVSTTLLVSVVSLWKTSTGLNMLWRIKDGETVSSMDGRWFVLCTMSSFLLCVTFSMLASTGELLTGSSAIALESASPLTLIVGQFFSWAAIPGSTMVLFHVVRFSWMGIQFNPQKEAKRFDLKAAEDVRSWEIDQRRRIVRGLKTLFKRKARLNPTQGTGVWIGLQHWFVLGLSRDVDEDDPEATTLDHTVGPPYYKLFSPEARFHYWKITQALKIDMILVEDGITFRRFSRVLRMMFEIYDVYGGNQQAEEMHFQGLPGVNVVIHSIALGTAENLGREDYPEPEYDDIARARILHVFKDRQESEELDETPDESRGAPVLSGV